MSVIRDLISSGVRIRRMRKTIEALRRENKRLRARLNERKPTIAERTTKREAPLTPEMVLTEYLFGEEAHR